LRQLLRGTRAPEYRRPKSENDGADDDDYDYDDNNNNNNNATVGALARGCALSVLTRSMAQRSRR
jgi:hypothetical protein